MKKLKTKQMDSTKICSKCGRELPISKFSKRKSSKDGLQAYCKECKAEYRKQYYTEHKAEETEYQKQYKAEHKKECAEYQKQYRTEHKVESAKYQKQYRTEHNEYKAEYWKQYYATLRGYCIIIRNGNIQADRLYGRIGEELPSDYPTIEDYMELLQLPDFYDGKQYDFSEMGLDRIDNDKPHTLDNVIPCTTEHNKQRHLIPFDVFKAKFN